MTRRAQSQVRLVFYYSRFNCMTRHAQLVHSVDVGRYVVGIHAISGCVRESVGRVTGCTFSGCLRSSGLTGRVAVVALEISAAAGGVPIVPEEIHLAVHARMTLPAIAQFLSRQIQMMTDDATVSSCPEHIMDAVDSHR